MYWLFRVTLFLQVKESGILEICEDLREHASEQQDVLDPAEAVAGNTKARYVVALLRNLAPLQSAQIAWVGLEVTILTLPV